LADIRKAIRESKDDIEKDQLKRVMTWRLKDALGRMPTDEEIKQIKDEEELAALKSARTLGGMSRVRLPRSLLNRKIKESIPIKTLRQMVIDQSMKRD